MANTTTDMTLNTADLAKHITVNVHIKSSTTYSIKLKVAIALIKLASLVAGFAGVEMDGELITNERTKAKTNSSEKTGG